uniref:Uncharacterized protein n=1 Tax=Arundo donax TaxID=35708 RepID=A0A0A9DBQ8_ARUDO
MAGGPVPCDAKSHEIHTASMITVTATGMLVVRFTADANYCRACSIGTYSAIASVSRLISCTQPHRAGGPNFLNDYLNRYARLIIGARRKRNPEVQWRQLMITWTLNCPTRPARLQFKGHQLTCSTCPQTYHESDTIQNPTFYYYYYYHPCSLNFFK